MSGGGPPVRVRSAHVAWLAEHLSTRDWAVLESVVRLRLVTGQQLERLHFGDLAEGRSRTVSRSRTLARLATWRVLVPLPRRIGGPRQGSTVTVYAVDTAGLRLLRDHLQLARRIRRPGVPGERFVRHALAIAELYTCLVEADRANGLRLQTFEVEPSWPNGLGGWLRPDAFVAVSNGQVDHLWWIEVDLATESLPTLRRKLMAYVEFWQRGGSGPRGAMPRVLVGVPDDARLRDVSAEAAAFEIRAPGLLHVTRLTEVVPRLSQLLH